MKQVVAGVVCNTAFFCAARATAITAFAKSKGFFYSLIMQGLTMEITTATERTSHFIDELLDVWEASVRATHHFLTDEDIVFIKPYAQQGFTTIRDLVYTADDKGSISGFMGAENGKIEMLFIHPAHRGHGLGKKFIHHALTVLQASLVDVNEQNIQGVGFYKHMGFKVLSRSPLDECGKPFPILHLSR